MIVNYGREVIVEITAGIGSLDVYTFMVGFVFLVAAATGVIEPVGVANVPADKMIVRAAAAATLAVTVIVIRFVVESYATVPVTTVPDVPDIVTANVPDIVNVFGGS